MVKNQMNHQDSGTSKHQRIHSNPVPLLSTPDLWFHLSRGDSIIMSLVMVVLRFILQSFQFNLTLNMFQIHTPLRLNKLVMMKWTISWNSSTQNTMKIFWILKYRCFRLDCFSHLLQNFIQSILCCFINMEKIMFQSQIACRTFLCLY